MCEGGGGEGGGGGVAGRYSCLPDLAPSSQAWAPSALSAAPQAHTLPCTHPALHSFTHTHTHTSPPNHSSPSTYGTCCRGRGGGLPGFCTLYKNCLPRKFREVLIPRCEPKNEIKIYKTNVGYNFLIYLYSVWALYVRVCGRQAVRKSLPVTQLNEYVCVCVRGYHILYQSRAVVPVDEL